MKVAPPLRLMAALACALTCLWAGARAAATAQTRAQRAAQDGTGDGSAPLGTATLQQCVTAVVESERSATFSGDMTLVPGSSRMQMRTDVLERKPGEARFHLVGAKGVDAWHQADAGVTTYRYLRQVTNLYAPAAYRGDVRLRWLNARGHVVKRMRLVTPECVQPADPSMTTSSSAMLAPGGGSSLARRPAA
jgi:hypothetical protein